LNNAEDRAVIIAGTVETVAATLANALDRVQHKAPCEAPPTIARTHGSVPRGKGWRVIERPRVSHQELESHVRSVWHKTWHALSWPAGWTVKWASLDGAFGLCVPNRKLILIDQDRQLGRTPEEFDRTCIHELVHALQPFDIADCHDDGFKEALQRATAFYFGLPPAR
jgi:hypothetical protein